MSVNGMIAAPYSASKHIRALETTDIKVYVSNKDTNGKFAIFEEIVPAHYGVPFHIHKNEDEMFHILEGQYQIWCGNETFVVNPGDTVLLPRNTPHTFYNMSSSTGRTLNTYLPGGFDEFAEILGTMSKDADLTQLGELSKKYGIYYSKFQPWEHEKPLHKTPERFIGAAELTKGNRFNHPEAQKIFDLIGLR